MRHSYLKPARLATGGSGCKGDAELELQQQRRLAAAAGAPLSVAGREAGTRAMQLAAELSCATMKPLGGRPRSSVHLMHGACVGAPSSYICCLLRSVGGTCLTSHYTFALYDRYWACKIAL